MSQNNDTQCHDQTDDNGCKCRLPRIGLALSGGGFRASIFHLGVIRRLEELGIMKHIHTVSAVSGGAIIAAYYVIEMETHLRKRREELERCPNRLDTVRLESFEKIANCFFEALDHNLRSRALVFSPFYHPLLFLKSLFPGFSRSDIMQKEFDRWFYHNKTLDDLPNVTLPNDPNVTLSDDQRVLAGPTVVLNATCLLRGERRGFMREPVSRLNELHRGNQNVLKLSRVVGASSAVPGVFPPTLVLGDTLVDGGVADNQGLDALVSLDCLVDDSLDGKKRDKGTQSPKKEDCRKKNNISISAGPADFDVLLVSDASGQMEVKHRVRTRAIKVLIRVMSIFQFQLRRKLLRILRWWEQNSLCTCDRNPGDSACEGHQCRKFAFVHLFLNLKGRLCNPPRVPSEYIPALGGIRTDLDQFSPIEREALMYHGYTLIDAEIKKICKHLLKLSPASTIRSKLKKPPLFSDQAVSGKSADQCVSETKLRKRVKDVLTAGSSGLFMIRSWRKYPGKSLVVLGPALLLLLDGLGSGAVKVFRIFWCDLFGVSEGPVGRTIFDTGFVHSGLDWISCWIWRLVGCLSEVAPSWDLKVWETVCTCFSVPDDYIQVLKYVAWCVLWVYWVLFLTYCMMRRMVRRWDLKDYRSLTGQEPTVQWRD